MDQQQRQRQIALLSGLKKTLTNAKQELNNDLTKLAIKNLPLMIRDDERNYDELLATRNQPLQSDSQSSVSGCGGGSGASQPTGQRLTTQQQPQEQEELEPLDLDP